MFEMMSIIVTKQQLLLYYTFCTSPEMAQSELTGEDMSIVTMALSICLWNYLTDFFIKFNIGICSKIYQANLIFACTVPS
jgi:hypothetical protein